MDIEQAAARLGIPASELAEVYDTPAGWVFVGVDGSRLIDVPADSPDGDGKTGLMFFTLPHDRYRGTFPVYVQPLEAEDGWTEPVAADGERTTEVERRKPGRPRKGTA